MLDGQFDAIENYEYNSENRKYNAALLEWRRQTKAPHIYRFTDSGRESVYIDGDAAVPPSAEMTERSALMRCGQLIGSALLIFLLSEVVGRSVLIGALRLFDIDIHLDFLSLQMGGSQWAVVTVRSITTLLKFLLPTFLLAHSCHIPLKISMPLKFGALPEVMAAIGAGMIISGIYSLQADSAGINDAQILFTYKNWAAMLAYGIFQALFGSLLAELFLRGTILTLLRQFGDPFAIVSVAIFAFLFPNRLEDRASELLIGLAAGYLLVRSGSILKCMLVRIVFTGLSYARLVIVYTSHRMSLWEYALLLISLGVLVLAMYTRARKDKLRLPNRTSHLTLAKKCSAMILSVTMLPWTASSILLTLMQLFN